MCPWTCVLGPTPRVLTTTESCATCPDWEPRSPAVGVQGATKTASRRGSIGLEGRLDRMKPSIGSPRELVTASVWRHALID
jgi:hypothetical protein